MNRNHAIVKAHADDFRDMRPDTVVARTANAGQLVAALDATLADARRWRTIKRVVGKPAPVDFRNVERPRSQPTTIDEIAVDEPIYYNTVPIFEWRIRSNGLDDLTAAIDATPEEG